MTLTGIFVTSFRFTSFVMAALVFLGFALGRLRSIVTDGKPNKQIVQGIGFELALGVANLLVLLSDLA
ncbi:DUF4345 family protein [Flagellimonas flava]|uniref:DUF4345 family protein n=1 Tax=Flagellimonas flava TaxID=570519 RepID=UPI0028BDB633|nr:DUF4345 family protein [Allomuricauda flava]